MFSDDPEQPSYYYPLIFALLIVLGTLHIILYFVKKSTLNANDMNHSKSQDDLLLDNNTEFIKKKKFLNFKYILAYIFTRMSMWSKAPYLYTLYNKVHGFDMSEIGILYILDGFSALVFGPITGSLADKYGRKLFSQLYNLLVILNLIMRMTGNRPLAYMAQLLTGIGAGLIVTSFESWINYESKKLFPKELEAERERFLKKLFKSATILDAFTSIIVSSITAVIFTNYGIFAAIGVSILFAFLGMLTVGFLWEENKPNADSKTSMTADFREAMKELKKREVLSIGIMESVFQGVVQIYLFAWTPILQYSTTSPNMNVGYIFTCSLITLIIGSTLFEILIIYAKFGAYITISFSLLLEAGMFLLVYYFDSFFIRMGLQGFFFPLNSIIKSKILLEKYRATLMSLFRIPLNAYVIIVLLFLKYMNPFHICLIAAGMLIVSFLVGVTLAVWPPKETRRRRSS